MEIGIIKTANQLIAQRIVHRYLSPEQGNHTCTIEGACVTTRRLWSRYGVPADATCWRHVFEHPEFGWSFIVRSVWRDGRLHEPVGVHTLVTDYCADDTDLIPHEDAACIAINEWAQSVPL